MNVSFPVANEIQYNPKWRHVCYLLDMYYFSPIRLLEAIPGSTHTNDAHCGSLDFEPAFNFMSVNVFRTNLIPYLIHSHHDFKLRMIY